jgi:membrane protease YdiL (CAAX protease family)
MLTRFEAQRTQAAWRDFAIGLALFVVALGVQSMLPMLRWGPDVSITVQALFVAMVVFAHATLYRMGRFTEVTGSVSSFGRVGALRSSVAGVAVLVLMFGVWTIAQRPLPWGPEFFYRVSTGDLFAFSFYVVVTAPIIEEVCFRGWMQRGLGHRFNPAIAILTPAILFAVLHAPLYSRPGYLLIPLALGLALGLVAERSRSLWPPVSLHALWNIVMLAIAIRNSGTPLTVRAPQSVFDVIVALAAIGLSSLVVLRVLARVEHRADRAGPTPVLDTQAAA